MTCSGVMYSLLREGRHNILPFSLLSLMDKTSQVILELKLYGVSSIFLNFISKGLVISAFLRYYYLGFFDFLDYTGFCPQIPTHSSEIQSSLCLSLGYRLLRREKVPNRQI